MNQTQEKRKYLRLNTVFPIEFQVVSKEDRRPVSELHEGFTRDVGKGGMGVFAKTLKDKDEDRFKFIPHETKLKIIINIPLDKEPIESFATVEWLEKQPGPIVDTYSFGISYDFINELEYEKIVSYVKWLRLKPTLILASIVLLSVALVFSSTLLFQVHRKKTENEKQLLKSLSEGKRAKIARQAAEKKASEAKTELEAAKSKDMAMQAALEKLVERKKNFEEISRLSEEDKEELQFQIEELKEEKALLEEQVAKGEITEEPKGIGTEKGVLEQEEGIQEIPEERLMAEEVNYNNFRELILNEKMRSLSAYVSTHRSSIYHAAGLFALAELRYKNGERGLAVVSYAQVIEMYPRSKYALYASHRMDQLKKNHPYEFHMLKDFYDSYNLPELLDYRNIKPYIK